MIPTLRKYFDRSFLILNGYKKEDNERMIEKKKNEIRGAIMLAQYLNYLSPKDIDSLYTEVNE